MFASVPTVSIEEINRKNQMAWGKSSLANENECIICSPSRWWEAMCSFVVHETFLEQNTSDGVRANTF